jgi:hypothetical protein
VSIQHRLRALWLCLPLLMGAFAGMPMRPEEIEELMHTMNQQKVEVIIRDESENGDDRLPTLIEGEPSGEST